MKTRLSFLASHGGSSARAIIQALRKKEIAAEIGVLISNNGDSPILQWCREQAVPARHLSSSTHPESAQEDQAILLALTEAATDLVICAGYMKKIGPRCLQRFAGRILNIHPALLPKYGGKGLYGDHVHRAVLAGGERESGATVHLATAEYDEGPILKQSRVPVLADDTVETLRARVQGTEPALYIAAIQDYLAAHPAGREGPRPRQDAGKPEGRSDA